MFVLPTPRHDEQPLTSETIDDTLIPEVEAGIKKEVESIATLNAVASNHPFFKSVLPTRWNRDPS